MNHYFEDGNYINLFWKFKCVNHNILCFCQGNDILTILENVLQLKLNDLKPYWFTSILIIEPSFSYMKIVCFL